MTTPSQARFRFADLFAGIGGFHVALKGMGGEGVFASEIDPVAAKVYKDNHGLAPHGDIRKVDASIVREHELLSAGFPCQAFSKAGAQRGLEDETRGTLFFDIARILEKQQPRFIVLENVRNLARHDGGRTWRVIIARLHKLGYRVSSRPLIFSPHLLPPELGGAPQFRERVFILGELAEKSTDPEAPLDWDFHVENRPIAGWNPKKDWDLRKWLIDHPAVEADLDEYALSTEDEGHIRMWLDLARRVGDRLPGFPLWEWAFAERPDESDRHPGWKVDFHRKNSAFYRRYRPAIDEWRGTWHPELLKDSRRKFEWQAQDHLRFDEARFDPDEVYDLLIQMRPSGIRVKKPNYVPALVAITQTSILGWERRRMTPSEVASLQGLDGSFILHPTPAVAYRHLGNGVNVGVVQYLVRALFKHSGFTDFVDPLEGRIA